MNNGQTLVALKFMRSFEQFNCELRSRDSMNLQRDHVVGIIAHYGSGAVEDMNYMHQVRTRTHTRTWWDTMITKEVEKGKKCNLCFFTIQLFHSLGRPLFISLSTFPLLPSICFHLVPPSSPTSFLPYFPPSLLRLISYLTFCTSLKLHATFIIFLSLGYPIYSDIKLSVCLPDCLPVYTSIWLPISLPISISDCPLIINSLSRYLTVYLGICLRRRVDQQSMPSVSMPSIRAFRHIPFVS